MVKLLKKPVYTQEDFYVFICFVGIIPVFTSMNRLTYFKYFNKSISFASIENLTNLTLIQTETFFNKVYN